MSTTEPGEYLLDQAYCKERIKEFEGTISLRSGAFLSSEAPAAVPARKPQHDVYVEMQYARLQS